MQFSLRILSQCLNINYCLEKIRPHLETLLFELCLPLLSLNSKDDEYWKHEPQQFVYSQSVKSDDQNIIKNGAETVIKQIIRLEASDGETMIFKLVNYISYYFSTGANPRRPTEAITPLTKESLMHCFECVYDEVMDEPKISEKLEVVLESFIIPEFSSSHDILRWRACSVFAKYGAVELSREATSAAVCEGILGAIRCKRLPTKVKGVEALNIAVAQERAKERLKPHLGEVLKAVLELMNEIELDQLVLALEGIVIEYADSLGGDALEVVNQLANCFFTYQEEAASSGVKDEFGESEISRASEACLDAISNILKAGSLQLSLCSSMSGQILQIVNVCLESRDMICFEKSLSLLNQLLYLSPQLEDSLLFYYPVLCYLVLGRPDSSPTVDPALVPPGLRQVLQSLGTQPSALLDGFGSVTPCFLNFVAKVGGAFLTHCDLYGIAFVDLLFEVVRRVGMQYLQSRNEYDLIYSLRIVNCLLENFQNKLGELFGRFGGLVFDLLSLEEPSNVLLTACLTTVSVMLWYSPSAFQELACKRDKWPQIAQVWLENNALFTGANEKEYYLFGLASLLTLPAEHLKVVESNLSLLRSNKSPSSWSSCLLRF